LSRIALSVSSPVIFPSTGQVGDRDHLDALPRIGIARVGNLDEITLRQRLAAAVVVGEHAGIGTAELAANIDAGHSLSPLSGC
jgi:hypothetical protein